MGKLGAVIVAAGNGTRMGTKESKQYLLLQNKPVLVYTLEVFQQLPEVETIILVTGEQDLGRCREYIHRYALHKVKSIIPGGRERQDSVYQGLLAMEGYQAEWVLVHDGVRPFVTGEKIRQCWDKAVEFGAAVLAVPVKDTIKVVDKTGEISSTPDRKSLWAIQTPQAFRLAELLKAHEQAAIDGYIGTDDAALIERLGNKVHVVEGDYSNVKLTTPEDLDWAEYKLLSRKSGRRNAKRSGVNS